MMLERVWLPAIYVVGTSLFLVGCGGESGPARYTVSGEITFNGTPVPAGHVLLTADAAAGSQGPQGFAPIRDGRFSTAAADGRGAGSGAYRVEVHGTDGMPFQGEEGEVPEGRMLFPSLRESVNLPARNSKLLIVVSGTDTAARATVEVAD